MSADVIGYSRLMAEDETATIRTLSAYREAITGRVRRTNMDLVLPRIRLAELYVRLGQQEEAPAVVREILAVNPQMTAKLAAQLAPCIEEDSQGFIASLQAVGLQ